MSNTETYLRSLLAPYAFDNECDVATVEASKPFSEYLVIDSMTVLVIIASIEETYGIDIATPLTSARADEVCLKSLVDMIE